MNYWNNSATINPNNYSNGPKVETVALDCMDCGNRGKERLPHATSDAEIMDRHFVGWTAKGFRNQSRTLCPTCVAKSEQNKNAVPQGEEKTTL